MRSFLHFIDTITPTPHASSDVQSFAACAVVGQVSILWDREFKKTVSDTSSIERTHEHLVLARSYVCFFVLALAHQQSGVRTR